MIHQSKYYLGTETEVLDAELYGIMKATEIVVKLINRENITDVWIFCDNQSTVGRMCDKRALPGQEYVLKTHNAAETLKNWGIKTQIH